MWQTLSTFWGAKELSRWNSGWLRNRELRGLDEKIPSVVTFVSAACDIIAFPSSSTSGAVLTLDFRLPGGFFCFSGGGRGGGPEDDGSAADRNTFIGKGTRCSSAAGRESFSDAASTISALVSSCLKLWRLLPIESFFFLKVLFCPFLTIGPSLTSALWLGWDSPMFGIALGVDATGSQSRQLLLAAAAPDDLCLWSRDSQLCDSHGWWGERFTRASHWFEDWSKDCSTLTYSQKIIWCLSF